MSRQVKNEVADRAELALMGFCVPIEEGQAQKITEYIFNVLVKTPCDIDIEGRVNYYAEDDAKNKITHIGTCLVAGMKCIYYVLETPYEEEPKPFTEDYGTGYPCAFCYVLNLDADWCSEMGDCFFQKTATGYYKRVS